MTETKEFGRSFYIAVGICLLAGFLNGFSGAGGGMITAVLLPFCFPDEKTDSIFAYTVLAVFLYSSVSAIGYLSHGIFEPKAVRPVILPALLGGGFGAWLSGKMNPLLIKKLFAGLLLYSGVRFILGT